MLMMMLSVAMSIFKGLVVSIVALDAEFYRCDSDSDCLAGNFCMQMGSTGREKVCFDCYLATTNTRRYNCFGSDVDTCQYVKSNRQKMSTLSHLC